MAIRFLTAALCLLIAACTASGDSKQQSYAQDENATSENLAQSPAGLDWAPLTISSGKDLHEFTVEVARTNAEQARGLMFRTELAPDKGMIFPFDEVRQANFWMKNTQISLDIIFVRADGSIESIAANTTPYSLDGVPSGEPVAMVLELAAGRSAELGLEAGDLVEWKDPRM